MRELKVGLCAIARNEAPYLAEWISFHSLLGFSNITIYDNLSTDGGCSDNSILRDAIVKHWTLPSLPQIPAYSDYLHNNQQLDWIIYLDIDEFLNMKNEDNVTAFLETYEDCDGLAINWRIFGSSGLMDRDDRGVLERFTSASDETFGPNVQIKTFFRPRAVTSPHIHLPNFKEDAIFVDTAHNKIPIGTYFSSKVDFSRAQINHYFTKSRAEFMIKRDRGRADVSIDDPAHFRSLEEFSAYDQNVVCDKSILRFVNVSSERVT